MNRQKEQRREGLKQDQAETVKLFAHEVMNWAQTEDVTNDSPEAVARRSAYWGALWGKITAETRQEGIATRREEKRAARKAAIAPDELRKQALKQEFKANADAERARWAIMTPKEREQDLLLRPSNRGVRVHGFAHPSYNPPTPNFRSRPRGFMLRSLQLAIERSDEKRT